MKVNTPPGCPLGLQVLAPLALLCAPLAARAQPPDNPVPISAAQIPEEPRDLPLLPLTLDEWLKQNGGLARLTLKMENARASEIAAEVQKQTGVVLVPDGDMTREDENAPRFSVEATGQTFWEAVSKWNRGEDGKPKLYLQRNWGRNGSWRMVPWNSSSNGLTQEIGPVRVTASQISRNRTFSRSLDPAEAGKKPDESESLYIHAERLIDPKLAPNILGLLLQIDSATDDKGRVIVSTENYQNPRVEDYEHLSISLQAPERDATKLRSLKGTLRLAVVTKVERWELDLKAATTGEKEFKSESSQVKLKLASFAPRGNGNGWVMNVRQERQAIGKPRLFKTRERNGNSMSLGDYSSIQKMFRVLNEAGEPLSSDSFNTRGDEENGVQGTSMEIGFSERFGAAPEKKPVPAKLIAEVPMEWREIDIPFELKDIPLP